VCKSCHRSVIHTGQYSGKRLTNLIDYDERLIDNRILHVESFVHKGHEHFGKKLEEKGWKKTQSSKFKPIEKETNPLPH